jgi:hypothetical protein
MRVITLALVKSLSFCEAWGGRRKYKALKASQWYY